MKPKEDLQFTAEQCALIHAVFGISGEAGEILDSIKKHVIYGVGMGEFSQKGMTLFENLREEIGDIYFYLEDLQQRLGLTREDCLEANMTKLAKRYPNYEYTDKSATERKDKQ